jgi:hypothetical protein
VPVAPLRALPSPVRARFDEQRGLSARSRACQHPLADSVVNSQVLLRVSDPGHTVSLSADLRRSGLTAEMVSESLIRLPDESRRALVGMVIAEWALGRPIDAKSID